MPADLVQTLIGGSLDHDRKADLRQPLRNPRQVLLSRRGQFRALGRPFILVNYEVVLIGTGRLRMIPLAEVGPVGLGYGARRDVLASLGPVMAAPGTAIVNRISHNAEVHGFF